ncbi:MAG: hypothetical protein KGS72_15915 [Cyanobacteria bacterium REEB67]|nr:hypothetical protein [Cyanobacteria bacterium REEB67]
MNRPDPPFWERLNRRLGVALDELLHLPACCMHLLEDETASATEILPAHRPVDHYGARQQQALEPHLCKGCGEDIIDHAQSATLHRAARSANITFHDWLINNPPNLDVYNTVPHPSGFEANVDGMRDEHLQRVEQYWYEHQLKNPTCASPPKPVACATAADWRRTVAHAQEEAEKAI